MTTTNLLQTLLASGIVAAVVGAVVSAATLFLFHLRQERESKTAAKAAARVIYLEIAFNINMLAAGARGNPPRFVVSRHAWDAKSDDLLSLLGEHEVAAIAAPYLQIDAFEAVFGQGPDDLWQARLAGEDQRLLRQLLEQFRTAEQVLRPKVWTGKRVAALQEAINQVPVPKPSTSLQRARGFFGSLPLWRLLQLLAFLIFAQILVDVRDAIRKRARAEDRVSPDP